MFLGDTCLSHEFSPVGIRHLRAVPTAAAPTLQYVVPCGLVAIEELLVLFLCGLVARGVLVGTLVVLGPTAPCDIVAGTHGRALVNDLLEGE